MERGGTKGRIIFMGGRPEKVRTTELENLHRNVIAIVIDRIQLMQVLICNRYYVLEYDIE